MYNLGAWVKDLIARVDFLNLWVKKGIPILFWISGFYFPQAFLTGTLQNYARRNVLSIDTIAFGYNVCGLLFIEVENIIIGFSLGFTRTSKN